MKKSILTTVSALLLAIVMITMLVTGATAENDSIPTEEIDRLLNVATDPAQVTSPFIEVGNKNRESIVGIRNYQEVTTYSVNDFGFPFDFVFPFDFGFGGGYGNGYGNGYGGSNRTEEQLAATGSGVVITSYGHVITNYHVVQDAKRVTVTVQGDEKEYNAVVSGFDAELDIAVLYVPELQLSPVTLGDSDQLQVGEWAIVVGNPLGEKFARTITVGIVSALDRDVTETTTDIYGRRTSVTNKMIQVDAAINSGNSGGGMFNVLGQLMGIPARKYVSSASAEADVDNIGMCIPVNVAKPLIRQVLENFDPAAAALKNEEAQKANASKPRMAVTIATLRNTSGTKLPNGCYVMEVEKDGPADLAGILPGDIIVEIDGTVISSSTALSNYIAGCKAGDELSVKLFRIPGLTDLVSTEDGSVDLKKLAELEDGEYQTFTVTLVGQKMQESSKR